MFFGVFCFLFFNCVHAHCTCVATVFNPGCSFSFKETLVTEYMNNKKVDEAVGGVKEMKPPKHFLSEMLNKMVVYSLDRSDDDKEHASSLFHALCTEGVVTGEHLLQVCGVAFKVS